MIVPDPTGRCEHCDAAGDHHYSDCPIAIAAEEKRRADSKRLLHAVTVVGCQCGLCTADL